MLIEEHTQQGYGRSTAAMAAELTDDRRSTIQVDQHRKRFVSFPWKRMLRIDWLGQTLASLCWIGSVFCYGIGSLGDGLQLSAAIAWLVANIAAIVTTAAD